MLAHFFKLNNSDLVRQYQAQELRALRLAKHSYRHGHRQTITKDFIQDCLRHVEDALDVPIAETIASETVGALTNSTTAYVYARTVERDLIAIDEECLGSQSAIEERSALLRRIRDPHVYLWQFMYRRSEIERVLHRLKNQCRKNAPTNLSGDASIDHTLRLVSTHR